MKNILIICTILFMGATVFAQDKNARSTVWVDGVCGMCKKRIETASIKTKGVKSAVWNVESKELRLIYNENKTDLATIQQSIADVGHDTKEIKATDAAYGSVHPCCLYRDGAVIDQHGN